VKPWLSLQSSLGWVSSQPSLCVCTSIKPGATTRFGCLEILDSNDSPGANAYIRAKPRAFGSINDRTARHNDIKGSTHGALS
jgi:hypothetical protein